MSSLTIVEMKISTNKFKDIIIATESLEALSTYVYKPNEPVCIKTSLDLENFHDFERVYSFGERRVYTNKFARERCPVIIEGGLSGTTVVVVVNDSFVVLVKDRTKSFLTNPCGSRARSEESFLECGIREVEEETGLKLTEPPIHCGTLISRSNLYNILFKYTGNVYYTSIHISAEQVKTLLAHRDHEISKVLLVHFDQLNLYCIGEHHLVAIQHVINKLQGVTYDWVSVSPRYLVSLNLF